MGEEKRVNGVTSKGQVSIARWGVARGTTGRRDSALAARRCVRAAADDDDDDDDDDNEEEERKEGSSWSRKANKTPRGRVGTASRTRNPTAAAVGGWGRRGDLAGGDDGGEGRGRRGEAGVRGAGLVVVVEGVGQRLAGGKGTGQAAGREGRGRAATPACLS